MTTPLNLRTAEAAEDMIICRDVHKWYDGFHAVRGVTTTIKRGEVIVIIGPSGSGKSTLLRTINRLERHERGEIIVDGILLNDDTRNIDAVRRDVGMVSQFFNLFPHMTVMRNITFAPNKIRKISNQETKHTAMELLQKVGAHKQAEKYPHQLSNGERQRVAIARALAMQPNIMLFDEPTSALDTEMVEEVLQVMRELAQSQMTIVAITHEMRFAREVADRVMMFDEGQIVEDRPPGPFFSNPRHQRLKQFLDQLM